MQLVTLHCSVVSPSFMYKGTPRAKYTEAVNLNLMNIFHVILDSFIVISQANEHVFYLYVAMTRSMNIDQRFLKGSTRTPTYSTGDT